MFLSITSMLSHGLFMESKMNETILKTNQTHDIFQADILHGELRILDWDYISSL